MRFSFRILETSLPRYYTYYPHFEAVRDRYVFVPKFRPREEPGTVEHAGFTEFKNVSLNLIFFVSSRKIRSKLHTG